MKLGEYKLIDEKTVLWEGKYYREGIGEISKEEARIPMKEVK